MSRLVTKQKIERMREIARDCANMQEAALRSGHAHCTVRKYCGDLFGLADGGCRELETICRICSAAITVTCESTDEYDQMRELRQRAIECPKCGQCFDADALFDLTWGGLKPRMGTRDPKRLTGKIRTRRAGPQGPLSDD